MAGGKLIAKRLIQWIEGSNKMGIVFKISLVYTNKPMRKVIQKFLIVSLELKEFHTIGVQSCPY